MAFSSLFAFATRLIFMTAILSISFFPLEQESSAISSDFTKIPAIVFPINIVHADSLRLTDQKVKSWIKTRIAIAKLQKQMKTNASDYDNVVQEFYSQRESMLESRGWSVRDFENAKKRIHAAISAMDMSDELADSRTDHKQMIADIETNEFYSDGQKQQMKEALNKMREQKKTQYINPTKPDWPAVRPYRSVFQQLMDWIAGNTSSPPDVE